MQRTLTVTHASGEVEQVPVWCGSSRFARRLPARIGRALESGAATATLDYDGKPRTAKRTGSGRYVMRIA